MGLNKYSAKKEHGFLIFSVVILFLVLTVLCSLVLGAFARANDQLLMTIKHHQLEQAALSSMAVLNVYKDNDSCSQGLGVVKSLIDLKDIELSAHCLPNANSSMTVNVTATRPNPSKPALSTHWRKTILFSSGD